MSCSVVRALSFLFALSGCAGRVPSARESTERPLFISSEAYIDVQFEDLGHGRFVATPGIETAIVVDAKRQECTMFRRTADAAVYAGACKTKNNGRGLCIERAPLHGLTDNASALAIVVDGCGKLVSEPTHRLICSELQGGGQCGIVAVELASCVFIDGRQVQTAAALAPSTAGDRWRICWVKGIEEGPVECEYTYKACDKWFHDHVSPALP